jgi:signal transduction histidine kinase
MTQRDNASLQDAERRIAELEQDLITARAAAAAEAQAVAARDALIAAISRELNNQLAPVTLAIERLRSVAASGDADRLRAGLALAERACATFAGRSRSLVEFSELAGQSAPVAAQSLDASQAIAQAAARHGDVARRAGCRVSLALSPDVILSANGAGLELVLDNLLANAFKFGAGRPVQLGLRAASGDRAVLWVRDEGPGMASDIASLVFGPFHYARPPATPGLGIGLWMAAQWVKRMGGTLRLANPGEPGACFEVELTTMPKATSA